MSQQVQELINKIKSEGVEAGQTQAKQIEQKARQEAQSIIDNAKREADRIILEAKEEIKKRQESTHMALKQASRDMLLSLRKEIQVTLQKLISQNIHETLTSDQLGQIIIAVVGKSLEGKTDLHIALSHHDNEKLKNSLVSKLQHQVKGGIHLKSSDDIARGFTISFDGGKSSFDFTDVALAEYIAKFVNPQVASLIKEAALS